MSDSTNHGQKRSRDHQENEHLQLPPGITRADLKPQPIRQCFKCKANEPYCSSRDGRMKPYCRACFIDQVENLMKKCLYNDCAPPSQMDGKENLLVVAVSGGAGSMAMLKMLSEFRDSNKNKPGRASIHYNYVAVHLSLSPSEKQPVGEIQDEQDDTYHDSDSRETTKEERTQQEEAQFDSFHSFPPPCTSAALLLGRYCCDACFRAQTSTNRAASSSLSVSSGLPPFLMDALSSSSPSAPPPQQPEQQNTCPNESLHREAARHRALTASVRQHCAQYNMPLHVLSLPDLIPPETVQNIERLYKMKKSAATGDDAVVGVGAGAGGTKVGAAGGDNERVSVSDLEDVVECVLQRALRNVAISLGGVGLLLGSTAETLSWRALAAVARGRGHSLPSVASSVALVANTSTSLGVGSSSSIPTTENGEVEEEDAAATEAGSHPLRGREGGNHLFLWRPMRVILAREAALYCRSVAINPVFTNILTHSDVLRPLASSTSVGVSHVMAPHIFRTNLSTRAKGGTIDTLCANFIFSLSQGSFKSTSFNVLNTVTKLCPTQASSADASGHHGTKKKKLSSKPAVEKTFRPQRVADALLEAYSLREEDDEAAKKGAQSDDKPNELVQEGEPKKKSGRGCAVCGAFALRYKLTGGGTTSAAEQFRICYGCDVLLASLSSTLGAENASL